MTLEKKHLFVEMVKNTGVTDELIKRYNDMNNLNNIMRKVDFANFKNSLTEKKSGAK